MKTKGYRNNDLCDIFANAPRDDERRTNGREIHSSRQLMQGNFLYSHGKHYRLAILDWDSGIALLRHGDEAKECSVSTYQHYRNAWSALWDAGWTILEIPFLELPSLTMASFWNVNNLRLGGKVEEAREKRDRTRTRHMNEYWDQRANNNDTWRSMFNYYYAEPERHPLRLNNM